MKLETNRKRKERERN